MPTFYEFFAGGGMARMGLGPGWRCLFANDFDAAKGRIYRSFWGGDELRVESVDRLSASDLPGHADLAWASFPCQDLSVAGLGKGLAGERSGAFWGFWRLMSQLDQEGRAPAMIVLENVVGAVSSHGGRDFAAIIAAIVGLGYQVGAMVIDAVRFVPQSRPRLFIVATRHAVTSLGQPQSEWTTPAMRKAFSRLTPPLQQRWVWFDLPIPPARTGTVLDLLEVDDLEWHAEDLTTGLLHSMTERNRAKLTEGIGVGYRRTRNGRPQFEVRFDGIAGCLRTPSGGSSRQIVVHVANGQVRTRWMTPREAARLMGLPDVYPLPDRPTEALHLVGDGLVVPVVAHLERGLLSRLAKPHARPGDAGPSDAETN